VSKTVCITGADRGLGFDLCIQFLKRGYRVFAGRFMPEWTALESLSRKWEARLVVLDLDVSNPDSIAHAAVSIASHASKLDILVNNAGISGDREASIFGPIDYEKLERMYRVNAIGPLRMAQALADPLLAGSGKLVVNISSEAGQINQTWREGWYGYCMSKAALNIQSNILHNELRKHGGKVLVLHPGWMRTYMSGSLSEQGEITSEESAVDMAETIHRYLAETEERAHPAFQNYKGEEMSW
jgi:NAD(P)-dependent dehydrogenase (short-subunit alcohol dehydrogenase family)